jgi:hypothetical protein
MSETKTIPMLQNKRHGRQSTSRSLFSFERSYQPLYPTKTDIASSGLKEGDTETILGGSLASVSLTTDKSEPSTVPLSSSITPIIERNRAACCDVDLEESLLHTPLTSCTCTQAAGGDTDHEGNLRHTPSISSTCTTSSTCLTVEQNHAVNGGADLEAGLLLEPMTTLDAGRIYSARHSGYPHGGLTSNFVTRPARSSSTSDNRIGVGYAGISHRNSLPKLRRPTIVERCVERIKHSTRSWR